MHSKISVVKIHSFAGHSDCIYSIEACYDQKSFFSASGDGMVVKWNLENPDKGELIAKMPNSIYALHFLKEQNLLVVGQNYEGVHLLDWESKKELKSVKICDTFIFDIQSHNNKLFVASGDGAVTVIDVVAWKVILRIDESKKSARSIAINVFTNEIAVSYSDCFVRVFDLSTFMKKNEWIAHKNSVFTLAYSDDNKILLSGARDARLKAWNAAANYQQVNEVVAHLYTINHIAINPDGEYFATASMDKSVKIWQSKNLQLLKVIDKARHAGHGTSINKLVWIDGSQLLSAGDDRVINLWQIEGIH
jgi:WD40 repeat protein